MRRQCRSSTTKRPCSFQRNEIVRPVVHPENNPHSGKDEHKKDEDNHGHNNRSDR